MKQEDVSNGEFTDDLIRQLVRTAKAGKYLYTSGCRGSFRIHDLDGEHNDN